MIHYLYLAIRDDKEKYVGVSMCPGRRFNEHFKGRGCPGLHNRVFSFIILDSGTKEYIYSLEKEAIKKYNCSLNSPQVGPYVDNAGVGMRNPLVCGGNNGQSKLTESQVIEILDTYYLTNTTYKKLGEKYSVSDTTIGKIVRNEKWKHIDRSKWLK